ncbi:efflux RND transporter permease subunit [Poriferisphaera sp. WC338]|uniref:efflux RND transporter permease subunit n=1 Tax=Poriferisphaera sp. WC338 TaxID=3425129 RepID=UPI003D8151B7
MEKLIAFALHHRMLMVVMCLLLIITGYWSYTKLPVDAFPDVSPNLVQVFTVTEGLAPEEIEMYVTYPVEAAMNGLPGVEKIRSISNFGLSVVNIYFEDGMDIYFTRRLVGERLSEAREQIPEGFGEPEMGPISTGMGLVLFYYLHDTTGQYSLEELRSIQDWIIKRNLQTVSGVTEVLGIGGYEKQFQINVNPDALLRYDLTLNDVIGRIESNNLNVGAQYIEQNSEELIVRSVGLASSVEDLRNMVVKTIDGTAVYIRDVAMVEESGALRRGLQTLNGESEVVAGMVVKLYGTNASSVIEAVENQITKINRNLPDGIVIKPYYQQKDIVAASVKTVTEALITGVVLVALVLLIFMGGFRASVVVAISIPFSVFFAFIAMYYYGLSANLMSLGGLAIAIGMMVDGTIVIVENVDRVFRCGKPGDSKLKLVIDACTEVGRPIVFAILIIIIVFLPLLTLQGVEGKTFRPLAYAVSLAMLGSLIFAIVLAPVFSALLMKFKPSKEGAKQNSEPFVVRLILIPYLPILRFFVAQRWAAVLIAVGFLAIGTVVFPQLGSEFTPKLKEGTIVVRLTMAPSISIAESKRNAMIAEKLVLEVPEVIEVTSRVGRGEVGAHADPINSSEMFVVLKDKSEWDVPGDQERIESLIREKVDNLPGIRAALTQPIEMTVDELLEGVRAELAIKLFGDDLDQLKDKADEIAAVVSNVSGAVDIQVDQVSGTPQLLIRPDREAVARYGLNIEDVQRTINAAVGGITAGQVFEGVRRYDIYVRYQADARSTPQQISSTLITTPDGIRIPLSDLASITRIVGPRQIKRENNQRFITIQCNVVERDIVGFVEEAQSMIDSEIELPIGYFTTWGGQFRLQQEANKRLRIVIPVTLLIIAIMLFSSFGLLRNALLILLNIPLALVGGVVGLYLTGQNLSVPASVGFIALFGIALENGMVLVTYLNQLREQGVDVNEASIKGASMRVRAVLMTAITTALGLIPLLIATGTGSEVQRPLATVVIAGLVTSTFLTLLVIPSLYKWFSPRNLSTDEVKPLPANITS